MYIHMVETELSKVELDWLFWQIKFNRSNGQMFD